jgi:hypothetical protein
MADIAECKDNHVCFYSEPNFKGIVNLGGGLVAGMIG